MRRLCIINLYSISFLGYVCAATFVVTPDVAAANADTVEKTTAKSRRHSALSSIIEQLMVRNRRISNFNIRYIGSTRGVAAKSYVGTEKGSSYEETNRIHFALKDNMYAKSVEKLRGDRPTWDPLYIG